MRSRDSESDNLNLLCTSKINSQTWTLIEKWLNHVSLSLKFIVPSQITTVRTWTEDNNCGDEEILHDRSW